MHPNPVERMHRDLGAMVRALTWGTTTDWEDILPQALFALRTAVCRMTGKAPFEVLFGRQPSQALDLAFGNPPNPPRGELDYHDYVAELRQRIDRAQSYARDNIARAVVRQRRSYHAEKHLFQVGMKVWLFSPPQYHKTSTTFWSGPFSITTKISDVVYEITPAPEMRSTRPPLTVSIDRLKLYRFPEPPAGLLPPSEDLKGDPVMTEDEFGESIDLPPPPPGPPARIPT